MYIIEHFSDFLRGGEGSNIIVGKRSIEVVHFGYYVRQNPQPMREKGLQLCIDLMLVQVLELNSIVSNVNRTIKFQVSSWH